LFVLRANRSRGGHTHEHHHRCPTHKPARRSHRSNIIVATLLRCCSQPDSYRNIAYLLIGLPLGTIWFTVLVTGVSVALSMLVIALLGIPMLLGLWYVTRSLANVERRVANALLGQHVGGDRSRDTAHGGVRPDRCSL